MMSLRDGPYHKMWAGEMINLRHYPGRPEKPQQHREEGYTLVALLAVMTVLALFALAAAPSIRQQAQREREIEAIYRGEQMAEAIRVYYSYQQSRVGPGDPALPTSVEKLLEGLPSGTKKVQILRASAARDPLSDSGEWRLVKPRSSELADFQQSVMLFAGNVRPPTRDPQLKAVELLMAPPVLPTLGIASPTTNSTEGDSSTGPFIGVASDSKSNAVIYYYGIDRHNAWIFTPLFR